MKITRILRGRLTTEHRPYECMTCHECFVYQHYMCPNCGGFSIERVVWTDEELA